MQNYIKLQNIYMILKKCYSKILSNKGKVYTLTTYNYYETHAKLLSFLKVIKFCHFHSTN